MSSGNKGGKKYVLVPVIENRIGVSSSLPLGSSFLLLPHIKEEMKCPVPTCQCSSGKLDSQDLMMRFTTTQYTQH